MYIGVNKISFIIQTVPKLMISAGLGCIVRDIPTYKGVSPN
jgi:hypothetical protein